MKITLDHNCLINIENKTPTGEKIRNNLNNHLYEFYIVKVGASEMLKDKKVPFHYCVFEDFINKLGLSSLKKINPPAIFDIFFWDNANWAGKNDEILISKIMVALFNSLNEISDYKKISRNNLCDILTFFCHVKNENDIFLTSDKNFVRKSILLNNIYKTTITTPEDLFS